MSRMLLVLAVAGVMLVESADAANLVSMKLCAIEDYDPAPGTVQQGRG